MPNFITKSIKSKSYPFGRDDVKFLWEVCGRSEKLIYTQCENESFLLTLKPKQDVVVLKGEKLSKPARTSLLQKALCVYRDENANEIISEAMAYKPTKVIKKSELITCIDEFMTEFNALIKVYDKIFIEIGFGSGRHLLYQAKNNKNTLIIGIEVYKPSIEQVAKLAMLSNLKNIRLINTDARLLLSLIDSNTIDKIFLHFPVPWDKAPHRRVVGESFAFECERVLRSGGNFELRTDSKEYAQYSVATFLNLSNSKICLKKNENLEISSKYEDRWKRQEKDIYDMHYKCEISSPGREIKDDMKFHNSYDMAKILNNFKNETIKDSDYFVHFEDIYSSNERILIKLAFGAFARPEHCFIKIENQKCEYFAKKPLLTLENLKAHKKVQEYLDICKV